jgi:hypothetical protein
MEIRDLKFNKHFRPIIDPNFGKKTFSNEMQFSNNEHRCSELSLVFLFQPMMSDQ